jgi:protein SCO1
MQINSGKELGPHRWDAALLILLLAVSVFAGCKKSEPSETASSNTQAKRYHLVGKVVSIDQDQATLNVDGQEIPGFMAAMTMPYPVRNKQLLSGLNPGDEITADVVVAGDGSYLENIVVTKKAAASPSTNNAQPTGPTHRPQPGEKVPDFVLVNQDGKTIHLDSFHGDVLMITFIYTRCPFPDFCPLVSKNFAHIYADLKTNNQLGSKIRLLSVSFDPSYDTPAVLRKYAGTFDSLTGGHPFSRWEFAAVPAKDLPTVANFFGLYYSTTGGNIVHSLSTTVISPDGKVFKYYEDNDWKPEDLIADATQSLQQDNPHGIQRTSPSSVPHA